MASPLPVPLSRLLLGLAVAMGGAWGPVEAEEWLVERAAESGLEFRHFNGMSGRLYYPEVVGAGGALFDYDNDGDLDLYLVQGGMLGADRTLDDALLPPPETDALGLVDRLYRNELEVEPDGSRRLRFVDVTEASGLRVAAYGMGAAVGDFDNDGWRDLLVTGLQGSELWRNRGDGTFRNVTQEAGVSGGRWSVSASFFDYDRDDLLDLWIVHYIDFSFIVHKTCLTERGEEDYCLPSAYRASLDVLLHNLGEGRFADVTRPAGLSASPPGNGLGSVAADFDGDGWIDVYVANDLSPNQLWLNRGDGTFAEEGLISGSGLNRDGRAEASMGVAAGDADGDGDLDLFMTHFRRETNTLFRNEKGFFRDATVEAALDRASFDFTSFGTGFFDFDNDGWLDLFVASGAVTFPPGSDRQRDPFPFDERNQLFRNLEGQGFEDVSDRAGAALLLSEVSRGVLFGDVDNDGDTDLVITNNNGPVRLLLNTVGQGRPWLGLHPRIDLGEGRLRDAHGVTVRVLRRGAPALLRRAGSDGSYASAGDPRVLVGLGAATEVASVEVAWADGRVEIFDRAEVGSYTTLVRGTGRPAEKKGGPP